MDEIEPKPRRTAFVTVLAILGALLGFAVLVLVIASFFYSSLSAHYPITIEIEKGMSSKAVTQLLKDNRLIRSRTLTNTMIAFGKGDASVVSGMYKFDTPISTYELVQRITSGDFNIDFVTVRIVEGATLVDMAREFDQKLPSFNPDEFFALLESQGISEGYLFPDTYRFLPHADAEDVITLLSQTFNEKVRSLPVVMNSEKTLDEIVILASIVEKEATEDSREIVANILQKRIDEGMPLQVDASFVYSIDKDTFALTKTDLQDDTNPYNTYVFTGLPPTALSAPSDAAIEAAADTEPTQYIYFLTGADGEMYYAKTFKQHVRNKELYLE
jgi:UPF0755 protein